MSGTDTRKAQLQISANSTEAEGAFKRVGDAGKEMAKQVSDSAKQTGKAVKEMADPATPAAEKLDRATSSMVASIQRSTAALKAGGSNTAAYFDAIAAARGVNPDVLKPYIEQLRAAEAAQAALSKGTANIGVSAAQTAFALRQVPAQFTDIAVSLQGGQNPLTVLLQQGGQLKDMFGGIGPAARAMGGYVAGLANPITVAAAVLVAFGIAAYKGAEETSAYNRALITTGNAAGTTAGQLQVMAANMGQLSGITQGAAADALVSFVKAGANSSTELERVSTSALQYSRVTGQALEDVAKMFVNLQNEPLAASGKLNESMGYLTLSTYAQIKALDEQGHHTAAVAAAQKALADSMDQRTPAMLEQLGYLERAWLGVKSAATGSWDFMKSFGRDDSLEMQFAKAGAALKSLESRRDLAAVAAPNAAAAKLQTGSIDREIAAQQQIVENLREQVKMNARVADSKARETQLVKDKISFDKEELLYATNKQKATRAIADETERNNRLVAQGVITQAQADKRVADIRDKYKDPKKSGASSIDSAQRSYDIEAIKKAAQAETDVYANQLKVLEALHAAGLQNDADYYSDKTTLAELGAQAQVTAIERQIAYLKKQNLSGAEKLRVDKQVIDLEAEKTRALAATATAAEVSAIQENAALQTKARAYLEARKAAQDYFDTTAQGYERELAAVAMGDAQRSRVTAQNQINDKYAGQRQRIEDKFTLAKDQSPEARAMYDAELELNEEYRQKALASWESYYARLQQAQGDWSNGANRALENYLGTSANVAASTEQMFTKAFKGMEDGIVDFVRTGTLDFSKLADSIIADLIRISVQQNLMAPLFGGGGGGSGGLFGMLGSFFTGGGGGGGGVDAGTVAEVATLFAAQGAAFGAGGVQAYARGGTFTNTVVSQPTMFKHGGGFGVMGEAGPEAIMPLRRGADGSLGVIASGGGGGAGGAGAGGVVVNIIESPGNGGQQSQRTENGVNIIDVMVEKVSNKIAGDIAQGRGTVTNALSTTYGLNRVAGAY
jgi:lambda family phage tail tape measure protein